MTPDAHIRGSAAAAAVPRIAIGGYAPAALVPSASGMNYGLESARRLNATTQALSNQHVQRLDAQLAAVRSTLEQPLQHVARVVSQIQRSVEPLANLTKGLSVFSGAIARIGVPRLDPSRLAEVIRFLKARTHDSYARRNPSRMRRVRSTLARLGLSVLAAVAPEAVAAALRHLRRRTSLAPPGFASSMRASIPVRVPTHEIATEIMRHGPPAGLVHPSPAAAT